MPNNESKTRQEIELQDSAIKSLKQKAEPLEIESDSTSPSDAKPRDEKNPVLAYSFALGAAFLFSITNFSMSWLSDLKDKAIYPQWFASYFLLAFYHIYSHVNREDKSKPFFSKETSAYYAKIQVVVPEPGTGLPDMEANQSMTLHVSQIQNDSYRFQFKRLLVPIIATVLVLILQSLISFTFYYAGKSNVNGGIIASIFSSSAIFSPILFFIFHNQKLSLYDMGGCLAIVSSVLVIGILGSNGSDGESNSADLFISIGLALGAGLGISMISLFAQWAIVTIQFPAGQIFYDGNFLYACIMLVRFIIEQSANDTFTLKYFLISNIQQLTGVLATTCLTMGLKYGKGGTVQAIEQGKSLLQTCYAAIIFDEVPIASQWLGMMVGILGIIIIVLQPQKVEGEEIKENEGNEEDEPSFKEKSQSK